MLPSLVIGLREGLEAALIVGIIAAFLRANGRLDLLRWVWFGVAAAVAVCLGVGIALRVASRTSRPGSRRASKRSSPRSPWAWSRTWSCGCAATRRASRRSWKAPSALPSTPGRRGRSSTMAFLAVIREGFETAVFLVAAFNASDNPGRRRERSARRHPRRLPARLRDYRGGLRINLARFFRVTGVVLVSSPQVSSSPRCTARTKRAGSTPANSACSTSGGSSTQVRSVRHCSPAFSACSHAPWSSNSPAGSCSSCRCWSSCSGRLVDRSRASGDHRRRSDGGHRRGRRRRDHRRRTIEQADRLGGAADQCRRARRDHRRTRRGPRHLPSHRCGCRRSARCDGATDGQQEHGGRDAVRYVADSVDTPTGAPRNCRSAMSPNSTAAACPSASVPSPIRMTSRCRGTSAVRWRCGSTPTPATCSTPR